MKYTENYNLRLPEGDDVINSADLDINYNAEAIDRILAELEARLAAVEAPDGAGIVYVENDK